MFRTSTGFGLLVCGLIMVVMFAAGWGCGGSCTLTTGGVAGWLYQHPDGTGVMITGDRIAPDGYEPVVGAHVYIFEFPELEVHTDANGRYAIRNIKPGDRTIVVDVGGGERARYRVRVRAGQITIGGGHSEGGGEI